MRVTRGKRPTSQPLQIRVTHNRFDEPLAESMSAIVLVDKNIAELGEDGVVADDAGNTNLFLAVIETEDQ